MDIETTTLVGQLIVFASRAILIGGISCLVIAPPLFGFLGLCHVYRGVSTAMLKAQIKRLRSETEAMEAAGVENMVELLPYHKA